jgi:hypothetical protein
MHFSTALTTLATALAVASKGSAFVMEIFDSVDCTGTSRHVNVYDNTCATWMGGFNSYLPKVYGGTHQRAFFFVPGNCGDLPGAYDTKWVDG